MNVTEITKKMIYRNIYMTSMAYKTKYKKMTQKYEEDTKYIQSVDTISDIKPLMEFRKQVDNGKLWYTNDKLYTFEHVYGYWKNIFGKNLEKQKFLFSPVLEHGLILYDALFDEGTVTSKPAIATFGSFRKKIIHKYSNLPVFCVGPYIHYADNYYSNDQIEEMKKRQGKTLLVFPAHSTDGDKYEWMVEDYIYNINALATCFDTVIVCVFWWNINDKLTQRFIEEGYRVVSAGYNGDVNFVNRLKTIIGLADYAVGDGIGTNVGFCISEKVPYMYIPNLSRMTDCVEKEKESINSIYSPQSEIQSVFLKRENEITQQQMKVVDKYWGINSIKTDSQINLINDICEDIVSISKGWTGKYSEAITNLMKEYEKYDAEKWKLLFGAQKCNDEN